MRSVILGLLPILLATAAAAADTPQDKADARRDDPEKLICKRHKEIGSLVASRKECMTKAQWAAQAAAAQTETRRMQETTGGPQ